MIDCGIFQGKESAQNLKITFTIKLLRDLFLIHVHIDHVDRLPYLIAAGFKGRSFCSRTSTLLLPTVLEGA